MRTHHIILLLLLALSPLAARAGEVWVQVSRMELREAPAPTAKLLAKVLIGTACAEEEGAPAKWVKLRCENVPGYANASDVGPTKPDLAALIARAKDGALPPSERLEAALRAGHLSPEDDDVLRLVKDAFFDVEFETFPKNGKLAVGKYDQVINCWSGTASQCLASAFGHDHDWYDARQRRGEVVVTIGAAKVLHVVKGTIAPAPPLTGYQAALRLRVVARRHAPIDEVMEWALGLGVSPSSSSNDPAPPMVTPSVSSLALLDSLPERWIPVKKGENGWVQDCSRVEFGLGIGPAGDVFVSVPLGKPQTLWTFPVSEVVKTDSEYRISYHDTEKRAPSQVILEWPSREPTLGRIGGQPFVPEQKLPPQARKKCTL